MKITLGTFKDQGDELLSFLEPRVGTKPTLSGDSMEIDDEKVKKGVRPRQVKTYIKRFLFMKGVRRNYRVFVSGKELTLQEIELGEEEEKKKEEAEVTPEPPKEEAKPEEPEGETPEEKPEAKSEKPKKAAAKKPRAKKKAEAED